MYTGSSTTHQAFVVIQEIVYEYSCPHSCRAAAASTTSVRHGQKYRPSGPRIKYTFCLHHLSSASRCATGLRVPATLQRAAVPSQPAILVTGLAAAALEILGLPATGVATVALRGRTLTGHASASSRLVSTLQIPGDTNPQLSPGLRRTGVPVDGTHRQAIPSV